MGQPVRGAADQLVLGPAQDTRPGRADAQPGAVGVGDEERVLRQGPQTVAFGQLHVDLALQRRRHVAQGVQRHLLVLDIGICADPPCQPLGRVEDRQRPSDMPAIDAIGAADAELGLVDVPRRQGVGPRARRRRPVVGMDDVGPAVAVQRAGRGTAIGVGLVVEPVELAVRARRPHVVGHGLGDGAELGFARRQFRGGFGTVDQLARAFGDRLHEGDLVGRPGARVLRVEIDDGAQPAAAAERHDQDGAGIDPGRGFQRPRLAAGQGVGEQVVDDDGFAGGQPGDDAFAEGLGRIFAEQRRHAAVSPADIVAEDIVFRVEQAVADARHAEIPPHQGAHRIQRRRRIAVAQQLGQVVHQGVARLGLLARRDLDRRAHGADADARRVEQPLALGRHPADDAVFLADRTVFDVVDGADVRIERRQEGDARDLAVFGMQAGIEVGHAARYAGRDAEHRLGAVGPGQDVGAQVEVPGADLGRVGRQAQRFLAEDQLVARPFQLQFDALAVVDVDQHAREARGMAVGVQVDAAIGLDPQPPVTAADTVLDAVRPAPGQGDFQVRPDIVQVIGMDGGQQDLDIDPGAQGRGVDAEGARETLVGGDQARRNIPDPGADDGAGIEGQADALGRFLRLGDVIATDEDAGDLAADVADRFVQQVDEAVAGRCFELDRHGPADIGLARTIDLVQQVVEALVGQLREGLAHAEAQQRTAAGNGAVGFVGIGVDVRRPFQDGGEARHLGQHRLHPLALGAGAAFGQHAFGGFDDDGDNAGGLAAFVEHRRIVEIHPPRLGLAPARQHQVLVAVFQRAAGQADLHDIVVKVGDLGPALAHLGAQQARMAVAGEHRIGVVVQHDAVFVPQHDDRHGRHQQQVDGGAQRLRPRGDGADRGLRPVVRRDQPAGFAAAFQAVDEDRVPVVDGVWQVPGRHYAAFRRKPLRTSARPPRSGDHCSPRS